MPSYLESILECAETRYGLNIFGTNRDEFLSYVTLEQDLDKIRPKIQNATFTNNQRLRFHSVRLILYACLTGKREIVVGRKGNTRNLRIISKRDLWALSPTEIGYSEL